jgi:hypothetical protein
LNSRQASAVSHQEKPDSGIASRRPSRNAQRRGAGKAEHFSKNLVYAIANGWWLTAELFT